MTTLHLNPQFDLSPPKESRQGASLVLAVLAHLLLLMALTWGISWNQEAILESSTAELWSSTPNLTNPAPPEPASLETQEVAPTKALPPVQAKDNPSQLREAQLAIEKTKKKEEEKAKEKERLSKLEAEKQRIKDLEKKKQKDLELEKARKAEEEKLKLAKERDKAKKETAKVDAKELAKQQAKEAKEAEQRRMEDLSRFQKSLGSSSNASASGQNAGASSATNLSSGSGSGNAMSANYQGKIIQFISSYTGLETHKPFLDNPSTVLQFYCAPDGSVTSWKIKTKSINPEWDLVVSNAIERIKNTAKIPKDIDGRLPPNGFFEVKVSP